MKGMLTYFLFMNLFTYFMFAADKRKARRNQWRIPEKRLLWLSFLGGAVGAWRGMHDFYHKTSKRMFQFSVPLFLLLQMAWLAYASFRWFEMDSENLAIVLLAVMIHIILFMILRLINKK